MIKNKLFGYNTYFFLFSVMKQCCSVKSRRVVMLCCPENWQISDLYQFSRILEKI